MVKENKSINLIDSYKIFIYETYLFYRLSPGYLTGIVQ